MILMDSEAKRFQILRGTYHGLAEGSNGELFTLIEDKSNEIVLRTLLLNESTGRLEISKDVMLSVMKTFDNWSTISKCRFLAMSYNKVFVSDLGLHKVYIVDLVDDTQSAFGYFGSQEGQLRGPSG